MSSGGARDTSDDTYGRCEPLIAFAAPSTTAPVAAAAAAAAVEGNDNRMVVRRQQYATQMGGQSAVRGGSIRPGDYTLGRALRNHQQTR